MRAGAQGERQRKHAGHGGQRGHHNGTQPALAGAHHAFLRRNALRAELLVGVEQQDAILGDNADHHDEAHEGREVEGSSGDHQGQEHAAGREQRGGQHGDGGGEIAEFEKQNDEDQHDGEQQDKGQVLERLLLFLILAAVLDADAGRHIGLGDGLLHLGHAVAEIHAFEAGGDGDIALQVFAPDFGLTGDLDQLRQRAESRGLAGGTDKQRVLNGIHGGARLLGEANANGVSAVVEHHGQRSGFPLKNGAGIQFHLLG